MTENSIVTFTTEYGLNSPYLAAIKGALWKNFPNLFMVDISSQVIPGDILSASYLLNAALKQFPAGSIHLVAVDLNPSRFKQVLLVRANEQFIICSDNGLVSILFGDAEVETYAFHESFITGGTFPELGIFVNAVKMIREGNWQQHTQASKPVIERKRFTPSVEGNMLKGSVIFVDGYENVITDIREEDFNQLKSNYTGFEILYRRKPGITRLSVDYDEERNGDVLALFNQEGYLEIAIRNGHAKSLLGLQPGGSIIVEFYD